MINLIPVYRDRSTKIPWSTSLLTALGLYTAAVVDWTLDLYVHSIQVGTLATFWVLIAKYRS